MVVAFDIAALGPIVTGTAAIMTAWAAIIAAKRRATSECRENLKKAWAEAERYSAELHELRMNRSKTIWVPRDMG